MHQILTSCREAAIATILLIPIYSILHNRIIKNRDRSILYLLFSIYLATMYAAVGLPDITYYRFYPHFNFQPFLYMFSAWETTVLNVLLFMPLGFFMPMLWRRYRSFFRTLLLGFSVTLGIELLQIFTYRATDVNDLITNTTGTILGFLVARILLALFPRITPQDDHADIKLVYGTAFGVMFFLYPFIARILL